MVPAERSDRPLRRLSPCPPGRRLARGLLTGLAAIIFAAGCGPFPPTSAAAPGGDAAAGGQLLISGGTVLTIDATLINAEEALRMATLEGARAIGQDDRIGSLEVGKRADLLIVGTGGFHQQPHYDPYSLLTYSTRSSDVETVIVEGRVVVADGRVLTLDNGAILERATAYRDVIADSTGDATTGR